MEEELNEVAVLHAVIRGMRLQYNALVHDNWILLEEIGHRKRKIDRLKREKTILIDKVIAMEENVTRANQRAKDAEQILWSSVPQKKRSLSMGKQVESSRGNWWAGDAGSSANPDGIDEEDGSGAPGYGAAASSPRQSDFESQCTAIGKDGKQCRRKSRPGWVHCWHHAPLDPTSRLVYCTSLNPKTGKRCKMPADADDPFQQCAYHKAKAAKVAAGEGMESSETDLLALIKKKKAREDGAQEGEKKKKTKKPKSSAGNAARSVGDVTIGLAEKFLPPPSTGAHNSAGFTAGSSPLFKQSATNPNNGHLNASLDDSYYEDDDDSIDQKD